MSRKRSKVCEPCVGKVTSPRRGVSLEQSIENHNRSCPAQLRIKEKKNG